MTDKNSLRESAFTVRDKCQLADDGMAARLIASKIIMLPELDDVKRVSGFYPINNELDCLTILKALHAARFQISLPTITDRSSPLDFHEWDMREKLADGPFNTKQSLGEMVTPEILIVPLLAFDLRGHRIGYGGGYYDRTLTALRKENAKLIAIGIGYDDQKLDRVPDEDYDQPVDMIITEKNIYRVE